MGGKGSKGRTAVRMAEAVLRTRLRPGDRPRFARLGSRSKAPVRWLHASRRLRCARVRSRRHRNPGPARPRAAAERARPEVRLADRLAALVRGRAHAREGAEAPDLLVPRDGAEIADGPEARHRHVHARRPVLDARRRERDQPALRRREWPRPRRARSRQYKLAPLEFIEPGFLVLKPDGTEIGRVDRITTFHDLWFVEVLNKILDGHGELGRPSDATAKATEPFENAEEMLLDGLWKEALDSRSPKPRRRPTSSTSTGASGRASQWRRTRGSS